uniref:Caveolin n=1 Tax=Seriola dumerili TaxID=41447 RepID=A0A3B4UE98_SERDU
MYSLKAWIPPGDTKSLIHDRDPKRVNKSLKVMFEDVSAEPPLVWSLDKVWLQSHALFDAPRPVSLAAGLLFAALIMPCVQLLLINMHWIQTVPFFNRTVTCCGRITIHLATDKGRYKNTVCKCMIKT